MVKIYLNIWTPLQTTAQYFTICDCVGTQTARVHRHLYRLIKIRHFLAAKIEVKVTFGDILVSDLFFPITFASRDEIMHSQYW